MNVSPFTVVRSLGVIFDSTLTFEAHIKNVTRVSFFHLCNIAWIRPLLSLSDADKLIHAFVTTRLDLL